MYAYQEEAEVKKYYCPDCQDWYQGAPERVETIEVPYYEGPKTSSQRTSRSTVSSPPG